ncbi:sensor histidine kinase [Cohnella sp. AR92]|uniref:sensor histidine kinase n=1 Tax=Cohnella sp. AR92 TaxID=648716 RepID=UPI000F8E6F4C|nr:sensor histidine kinase [Cohnella sp. AR92]RUS45129.1 sensor histidine kinase [Cohnella sp. AR92]
MRFRNGPLRFVNDISLNYKFVLIYLFCVLMPIIVINSLFLGQVSRNIEVREQRNLQLSMDRAVRELRDILIGGVTLSKSISTDRSFYELLDRDYEDAVDYYEQFAGSLHNKMTPFLSAYSYVDKIEIYTDNDSIESGGNYIYIDARVRGKQWYRTVNKNPDKISVFQYKDKDPMNTLKEIAPFSIIRKMNEYPIYGKHQKWLKIDLNVSKLAEIVGQNKPELNLRLVDGSGATIVSSFSASDSKQSEGEGDTSIPITFESPIGNESYLAGITLQGVADSGRIAAALRESREFIWMLGIFCTIVPTALIFVLFRSYNYRIKRLWRHMEKIHHGKFDLIRIPEGKDEIGGLIRSFNLMAAKIHSLINDVYKLEIQKKDLELEQVRAEMNLLQSQMNPHFLFNTLNALLVVSVKNQYGEVSEIIRNLSQLLRRMINWSEDLVPLEDEIRFTKMYLEIEKFRFSDRFGYTIEVEEEAKGMLVPKMCVQPLVENACKHGLQAVKGQRRIWIRAGMAASYLIIEVEDNGIGMDGGQLKEIHAKMREPRSDGTNVGLRNVYQRLQLYYGELADFRIQSEPDEGTKINCLIPIKSSLTEKERKEHAQSAVGR